MKGLKRTLADLSKLKSRFERLISTAARSHGSTGSHRTPSTDLEVVKGFGSNPGHLRMLAHVPRNLPKGTALVVALHGCTQTAADYDHGSGWSALADAYGFAVVFPEQQRANNPNNCFNWFHPGDTARGAGEALSIAEMTNYMIGRHALDRQRVFIAGLSAGGAMSAAMLAAYPDVFAGGAVIGGLPHGVAANAQEALQAMAQARRRSPREWGDLVRMASPHRGPWPKISLWHGSADSIVVPQNMEEALRQWMDVHGVSATPDAVHQAGRSTRRVWRTSSGDEVIEAISIEGMAHGVPIGMVDRRSYGIEGPFHFDVGISSTHRIARFWGIAAELGVPAKQASHEILVPAGPESAQLVPLVAARVDASNETSARHAEASGRLDPRVQITAALKAAGLLGEPVTKSGPLDPRRVVQNTLRSVGLLKD